VLVADQETLEEARRIHRGGGPVGPSSVTDPAVVRSFAEMGPSALAFFPDSIDRYLSPPEFRGL
jgi:cysteine synthase